MYSKFSLKVPNCHVSLLKLSGVLCLFLFVPVELESWLSTSRERIWGTCRSWGSWRGGRGWTGWCAWVAASWSSGTSGVADSSWGRLPAPPRRGSRPAFVQLEKNLNLFEIEQTVLKLGQTKQNYVVSNRKCLRAK